VSTAWAAFDKERYSYTTSYDGFSAFQRTSLKEKKTVVEYEKERFSFQSTPAEATLTVSGDKSLLVRCNVVESLQVIAIGELTNKVFGINSSPVLVNCISREVLSPCGEPCPIGFVCNEGTRTCEPVPAECGNGVKEEEAGEKCDDGDTLNCDGCSATCQIEECGNGTEECDEECDDGNLINGDGCSSTCQDEGPGTCTQKQLVDGCTSVPGDVGLGAQFICSCPKDEVCPSGYACTDPVNCAGGTVSGPCRGEPGKDCCDRRDDSETCVDSDPEDDLTKKGVLTDSEGRIFDEDRCSNDNRSVIQVSCDQGPRKSLCPSTVFSDGTEMRSICAFGECAGLDPNPVSDCGDGLIQAGEQCDPPGVGCDENCQLKPGVTCTGTQGPPTGEGGGEITLHYPLPDGGERTVVRVDQAMGEACFWSYCLPATEFTPITIGGRHLCDPWCKLHGFASYDQSNAFCKSGPVHCVCCGGDEFANNIECKPTTPVCDSGGGGGCSKSCKIMSVVDDCKENCDEATTAFISATADGNSPEENHPMSKECLAFGVNPADPKQCMCTDCREDVCGDGSSSTSSTA